jgi:hypothetical protein
MPKLFKLSRGRLLIGLLLLVCAVVVSHAIYSDLQRRGPFWDKYKKVQPGMTQKEVEAILGPPTSEEDGGGITSDHACSWKAAPQTIVVYFNVVPGKRDDEYGAVKKRFYPETLWEKLVSPETAWEKRLELIP